ncbi:MAG: hypothetical protein AB1894_12425 [Chloroflexota bacterium]
MRKLAPAPYAAAHMARLVGRQTYLHILRAALDEHSYRFASQACLDWLAVFPGDLAVALIYSRALLGDGRTAQALPVLKGLSVADPEFLEVVQILYEADFSAAMEASSSAESFVAAHLFALDGAQTSARQLASWGLPLWEARQALSQDDLGKAEALIRLALDVDVPAPLAAVTHLQFLQRSNMLRPRHGSPVSASTRIGLAERYHKLWPDCLACSLFLADWLSEAGDASRAVALLHQAASRDVSGQVARRLWGIDHPYLPLWPERLEVPLKLSVPAEVAARLGWNRLTAGQPSSQVPLQTSAAELPPRLPIFPTVEAAPASPPSQDQPVEARLPEIEAEPSLVERSSLQSPESTEAAISAPPEPVFPPDDLQEPPEQEPVEYVPAGIPRPSQPTTILREEDLPEWLQRVAQAMQVHEAPPELDNPPIPQAHATPSERSAPLSAVETGERSLESSPPDFEDLQVEEGVEQASSPDLHPFRQELERLAARLHLPSQKHVDGRYPVYVIFSLRNRLEAVYGTQLAAILEAEMYRVVQVVQSHAGWGARLYFPDDPQSAAALGLQPVQSDEPSALKAALVALDAALAQRGEMIGALLIVGGPEIVPFHHLPNPLDDQDVDVPSDCPYANRNTSSCASAALLPEWPVGRLPGGAGQDARLLLSALRRISAHHTAVQKAVKQNGFPPLLWARRWLARFLAWVRGERAFSSRSRRRASFGYTAAVWRQAAALVYQPIGEPARLHVSPPLGVDAASNMTPLGENATALVAEHSLSKGVSPQVSSSSIGLDNQPVERASSPNDIPVPLGKLAYFNLHGLADAPEWYGQRHPLEPGDGPDYPVALRPQDIEAAGKSGDLPLVVFSEACYGLHILDKTSDQALALKFLETGSLAVIGSTCMAYGSLGQPLTAADLLAQAFWRFLKQGLPVGEALRQARLNLVDEMNERQGYLDVEDQKTLLSFTLLGDPLAQPDYAGNASQPKVSRLIDPLPAASPGVMRAVCDRCAGTVASAAAPAQPVPEAVLQSVRQVVAHSLPEMAQAKLAYTRQRGLCCKPGGSCAIDVPPCPVPGAAPGGKSSHAPSLDGSGQDESFASSYSLVTLSKQIPGPHGQHPQYARLTLDDTGKLVKLVVSK